MTGVSRGLFVAFTHSRDDNGQPAGEGRGTVLDRGPGAGEWWVMPQPAGGRALLVKARAMTATAPRPNVSVHA